MSKAEGEVALVRPEFVEIKDGLPTDIVFGWWRSRGGWTSFTGRRCYRPGDVISRTHDRYQRVTTCAPAMHCTPVEFSPWNGGVGFDVDLVGIFGQVTPPRPGFYGSKRAGRYRVHYARVRMHPNAKPSDVLDQFTEEHGIRFHPHGQPVVETLPFDLYWEKNV